MKRILYLLAAILLPFLLQAQTSFYNVKQYGATGKKSDYATKAIQAAIDAAAKAGGGTVYFPAGDYLSAQINLRDNITLWIDSGAKIWASNKDEDYSEKFYCEDTAEGGIPMVIYGNKVRNIRITGGGAIEGQPEYRQEPYRYNQWTKEDCDAALEAGLPLVCTRWKNRISNIYLYDCQDVRSTISPCSILRHGPAICVFASGSTSMVSMYTANSKRRPTLTDSISTVVRTSSSTTASWKSATTASVSKVPSGRTVSAIARTEWFPTVSYRAPRRP